MAANKSVTYIDFEEGEVFEAPPALRRPSNDESGGDSWRSRKIQIG